MKISELPAASSVTDSDYVLAVQNGQNVKATATAFKGDKGDTGQGVLAVSQTAATIAPEGIYPLDCLSVINVFAPVNTTPQILNPAMTGYTTPSGVVTASPDPYANGWKAFDYDNATSYYTQVSYGSLTYLFPYKVIVNSYTLNVETSYDRQPDDWAIEASNDGVNWVTLDNRVNQSAAFANRVDIDFYFTNTTAYLYYKLSIYNTVGGAVYIYKLNLSGYAGYRTLTNGVDYEVLKGDPSDRQITGIKNLMATETQFLIDYVNDQQLDNNGILFINGSDGVDGVDGVDGIGVPPGGTAGQVLSKNSTTDFDTHWVDQGVGNVGVVDLTNATTDYPLAIGETATLTYTSATSVPLHVATVEGMYEVDITCDYSSASNGDYGYLKPNNIDTGANAISEARIVNGIHGNPTTTNFRPYAGVLLRSELSISTKTTMKTCFSESYCIDMGTQYDYYIKARWSDTTTAWTSLGTLTFGTAQSGKIVIKRII